MRGGAARDFSRQLKGLGKRLNYTDEQLEQAVARVGGDEQRAVAMLRAEMAKKAETEKSRLERSAVEARSKIDRLSPVRAQATPTQLGV